MFLLISAALLDFYCGDPPWLWHPVRGVGWLATRLEPRLRGWAEAFAGPGSRERGLRLAGAVGVGLIASTAALGAYGLASIPGLGFFLALYLAYAGLAQGQLLEECRKVAAFLEEGELDPARRSLAYLVSRDTSALDRSALGRTLAETLSENFNDGFVAPYFFLLCGVVLGGRHDAAASAVALLWGYKAISTLDSMWGYKTERWRAFGWAAARADDVLAYAPARLSSLALVGAGSVLAFFRDHQQPAAAVGGLRALLQGVRADAAKTESSNAGWPMSAAAWVLHCRVGGPAVYFGQLKDKPWLGPEARDGEHWDAARVSACLDVTRAAGVLAAAGFCLLGTLVMLWRWLL